MANKWFRLYSSITIDPIVEFLSFEDQRHFVWILCLKNDGVLDKKYPKPNMLDVVVARKLGLQGEAFNNMKARLVESELIDENWQPRSWSELQFESDNSSKRVKKHREKKKSEENSTTNECNNSETLHTPLHETLHETGCNVTVTPPDTDTDTETDIKTFLSEKISDGGEADQNFDSGSASGNVADKSGQFPDDEKPPEKIPKFTSDDLKTAEYIHSRLFKMLPEMKTPNLQSWAEDVRLMRERDGRAHKRICEVFRWANTDSFWQANILSPRKLREQFDVLVAKIQQGDRGNEINAANSGSGKKLTAASKLEQERAIVAAQRAARAAGDHQHAAGNEQNRPPN